MKSLEYKLINLIKKTKKEEAIWAVDYVSNLLLSFTWSLPYYICMDSITKALFTNSSFALNVLQKVTSDSPSTSSFSVFCTNTNHSATMLVTQASSRSVLKKRR